MHMNRIKYLQTKKLLKELEWVESDYEWRNEIVCEADSEFINKINSLLDEFPELKSIYKQEEIKNIESPNDIKIEEEKEEEEKEKEEIDKEIKLLYRDIAKISHPDKTKTYLYNDAFIKATNYYNLGDKIGIYKIALSMDIDIDLNNEKIILIEKRIEELKNKIFFIENKISYKWYISKDDEKNKILLQFLKDKVLKK